MNKNFYRSAHNANMPTPDNRHPELTPDQPPSRMRRLIAVFTLIAYIGQPLVVTAQIIADQNAAANKRPVVDNTANGLPLVQIATPNASGLSHNQYNQFNVGTNGAILNNSQTTVQTQQGGYVSANPYLTNGAARIILNEVTGAGASSLRGYTEVAGQRAEVIIANPNGINCDGCGFINTSRGMLTTGIPVLGNSGSLDAFRVTGGQITIGAGGLNGANLDQLDLISRSLQVNGQIWANNLNVITGANQVNYSNLGVQVIQGNGAKPTVGIDVALLGGMYANKIRLLGTEAGVGVNSQGTFAAQSGDFTLDNQGQITLSGSTTASGNLSITGAAGTNNTGTLYGKQTVQLSDQSSISNSGTLSAQGNLNITAASLNSGGTLGAGIDANGNATQNANLNITTTSSLAATGQNLAGTDIALTGNSINLANSKTIAGRNTNLTATTGIDNTRGTLQTAGTLTANAGTTLTNTSGSLTANQITVHAADLNNQSGKITQTGTSATTLAVSNTLDNTSGIIQTNSTDLSLTPQTLKNDNGSIAHAGQGVLNISTGALSNNAGSIATNGQLTVNAASLNNRSGSINQAGTANTSITTTGNTDNTGGSIATNGLKLSLQLGSLNNTQGRINHLGNGPSTGSGQANLTLTIGAFTNTGGTLSTTGQTAITASSLDNQSGTLTSTGKTDLTVSGAISNTGGNIQSGTALNISAASLSNSAGRIVSLNSDGLNLNTTGQLGNSAGGVIGGNGNVTLNAGSIGNSASITAQNNLIARTTGTLDNSGGTLSAGNTLTASAGTILTNNSGNLTANLTANQLSLTATDLSNLSGRIVQTGTAATTLAVSNTLDNTGGTIQTNSADLSLTPQTLKNDRGTIAHAGTGLLNINTGVFSNNTGNIATNGQLALNAASISNQGGAISAQAQATLNSAGNLDNSLNGYIGANSLNITDGGLLNNASGKIESGNNLTLNTQNLTNTGGTLQSLSASALNLTASQGVSNTANGFIGSNGQITLTAASLDNTGSQIYGKNALTLRGNTGIVNNSGLLQTQGNLDIGTGGALRNRSGSIEAAGGTGTLAVSAASIDNTSGRIANKGTATSAISGGGSITNTGGTIGGNGDLTLSAATLSNTQQGLILSGNNLTLDTPSLSNVGGKIYAFGNLSYNRPGATFDNSWGNISSSGTSTYNLGAIYNTGGSLTAGTDISLTSGGLYGNGQIIANRDLGISLQGDYNYATGTNLLGAGNSLGLNVSGTFTNSRTLEAPGSLTFNATSIINNGTFNAATTNVYASYITNNGNLYGDTINTSSYRFTNYATIIGNNIEMSGYFLTNVGAPAIIAATNNINLWTSISLENSNGAEIYSMGNINIAANSSGAPTQYVFNYGNNASKSSLIDAGGSININATTLDNKRAPIAVGQTTSVPTLKTLTNPPSTIITNGGFFVADIVGGAPNTSAGTLTVGGSTIYYENVAPAPVAVVEYNKAVTTGFGRWARTTYTPVFVNQADITGTSINYIGTRTSRNGPIVQVPSSITVRFTNGTTQTFSSEIRRGMYYTASYYSGYNPAVNIHPSQLRTLQHPFTVLNEYRRDLSSTTTNDVITSAVTQQALMRASGNININVSGSLTNYVSTIAAGNTLSIAGAGAVNNQALTLVSTTATIGTSYFNGGYSVPNGWGGSYWQADFGSSPLTPTSSTTTSTAYSSVLSGGYGAVIHAGVVKNSAGGTSTQITGSTLSNTANAATPVGSARTAVQSASITTNNSVSGTPHTTGSVASINLAPVALANIVLPTSALYTVHPQPDQKYLIETNKRFTDYKTYTGSDYLLGRLSMDPAMAQKRLGDGFYEQKLISDQITELTGRRFTGKFTSVEDQTRALMDAAAGESKPLNLSLGIALSKEQAAALTRDIVWMVNEQVTLPDGTTTTALVPRVYLSAQHAIDLKPDGALIAGDVVDINTTTVDNSGTIKSTTASMIAARDILNSGNIGSGGDLLLKASHDIRNESGSIAGRRVALNAGHDIINTTATSTVTDSRSRLIPEQVFGSEGFGGVRTVVPAHVQTDTSSNTVVGATGSISASDSLSLEAGNDIQLTASRLSAGGNTSVTAGHNITVGTLAAEAGSHSSIGGNYNTAQTTQLTSSIQTGGNLLMKSGNDLHLTSALLDAGGNASLISGGNLTLDAAKNILSHDDSSGRNIDRAYDETVLGANLKTGGNLTLAATGGNEAGKGNLNLLSANLSSDAGRLTLLADNNVNIGTTQENHSSFVQRYSESGGFMSGSSTLSRTETHQSLAVGSSLAGDSIAIKAGKADAKTGDINVIGSSIAGTHDVTLDAGRDINILAATSTSTYSSYTHTTESGFMSNGGMSFTYGSRETTDKFDSTQSLQSQNRSMVGSTNGNLTLKAGRNALISGSDIVAANDINIAANNITINSGLDQSTSRQEHDQKQSGLTVAVSVGAVNTAQTVNQMGQAYSQSKNGRTKALALMAGGLAAMNGMTSLANVSASATVGSSESHSDSTQTSAKNSGSKINAGGNLNLIATADKGQGGNITIQGSDIKAGRDMTLAADNNIALLADQDTSSQVSHNSSSSSGAGVGANYGSGGAAFGVTANAAKGHGNSDGHDVSNINTHLDAGNILHIKSGKDTTLKGAVANGKQIIADIGGNLNIESLQDTSTYHSEQENVSVSATAGVGVSGSANYGQSKINGNYAAVTEQSGLKAGDNGFQINVKGNTNLKGAVIESTDTATDNNKNTFTTATLTTSDIRNVAEYDAQSVNVGVSGGTGGSDKPQTGSGPHLMNAKNGVNPSMPMVMGADGKNESTTKSGISGATLKITDNKKQKQLTGKDATETVATLNKDVKTGKDTSGKISNNLDVAEIQTGFTVTQTLGQQVGTFMQTKAAEADAAKAALEKEKAKPESERDPTKIAVLTQQVEDTKQWGPSGTYRMGTTALVAAFSGNVTGGTAQLVQGAAVNYLQSLGATEVKKIADSFQKGGKNTPESETVRAALHAIVACAGASAQGSDCSSGALGASAGSVINSLMGGDPATMSAKEKEDRKNLVTSLVAGIATATNAQASTATSAAQIETENNFLSPELSVIRKKAEAALAANPKDEKARKVKDSLDNLDNATKQQMDELLALGKAGEPGAYDAAQKIITTRNVEAASQLNNCAPPYDCAAAYKPSSKENALAAVQLPNWGSGETTPTADPITAYVMLRFGMKTPLVSAFGAASGAVGEAANQRINNGEISNYEKITYNAIANWAIGPIASNLNASNWKGIVQFGMLSGTTGAAVTTYNNSQQGSNDSVLASFGFSAVGGGAGAKFGNWLSQSSGRIFTSTIPNPNYDPRLGALLSPSMVKVPNQNAAAIANEFGGATIQAGAAALTPNISNSTLP